MKTFTALILAALFISLQTAAFAGSVGDAVEVEIRTDDGRSLPIYPAKSQYGKQRVYAEAVKGEHYRIIVHNRLNRRVGLVVAVDGRNIISGKKSWLGNNERMYILEPYGAGEYNGWRTGEDKINRFYFSSVADSYAAAFKDESAMGVIAVAVFPEVIRYSEVREREYSSMHKSESAGSAVQPAPAARESARKKARGGVQAEQMDRAGTGYGQEEYSPSVVVAFEPESSPRERVYIKYEWRETLCKMGVIGCYKPKHQKNRLWDNDYAPPPPRSG